MGAAAEKWAAAPVKHRPTNRSRCPWSRRRLGVHASKASGRMATETGQFRDTECDPNSMLETVNGCYGPLPEIEVQTVNAASTG